MIYKVQGRRKFETSAEILRKLMDGTIECQDPDGREIVASMKRAVISEDGIVRVKSALARSRFNRNGRQFTTITSPISKQKRSRTTPNSMVVPSWAS